MSAERLRAAAALLRERAEAEQAILNEWGPQRIALGASQSPSLRLAHEFAAMWTPALAFAAADWLTRTAEVHLEDEPLELMLHVESDESCQKCEDGIGHLVPVCRGCYPSWDGMDGHAVWPCSEFKAAIPAADAILAGGAS